MSTNFALSLSFEGIQLLHRVTGGWRPVGEADVEADDLDAQLADLRKKALALEPGGIRSKIVIPLDQIKYMALDTTQTSDEHIQAALDGETPYDLSELVIDCERRGGRTHIAAVARETLDEAEAFARAHQFNPVCFVAIPEPFTFQSEVFFGPTRTITDVLGMGATAERDVLPIMIVGTRVKSRLLIFDIPEEELPPAEENDLATLLAPHLDDGDRVPEASQDETDTAIEPPADAREEVTDETNAETVEATLKENASGDPTEVIEHADDIEVAQHTDDAPEIDAVPPEDEAVEPPSDIEELVADDTSVEEEARPDQPAATEVIAARHDDVAQDEPTVTKEPEQPELFASTVTPPEEPEKIIATAPAPKTVPVFAMPVDPIIEEYHTARPKYKRRARRRIVGTTQVAPAPAPGLPSAAEIAAIPAAPTPPRRAHTAPARPAMSKKALVGAALAASFVFAGLLAWMQFGGTQADPSEDTTPTVPAAQAETVDTANVVPAAIPSDPDEATSSDTPVVTLLDIVPPSAPLPQTASVVSPEPVPAVSARATPALAAAAAADAELPAQNPMPVPQSEAPTAQASLGAPVLRGQVLSPDEAAQIYAVTGVWQRAPRIVSVPRTAENTGVAWPDPDVAPDAVAQPIVPDAGTLEPGLSFVAPADPPPPEATFTLDDDGFVAATPEGTITPEGAVVFSGLPEDLTLRLRPTLTPEDLERMALLAPAPEGVVVIAGSPPVTPPLRAADAVPQDSASAEDETRSPGSVGLAGLVQDDADDPADATVEAALGSTVPTGPRPSLRPSDLVPLIREDLPTNPDITSVIAGIAEEEAEAAANAFVDPTANAVTQSGRPRTRPDNFARVVAAARQATPQREQPRDTAAGSTAVPQASVAVVAPPRQTGPVPGGVARAATQEDAIRLRDMNLIGVYGRPNARRALVRLSSGRYVRVEIGSSLDGGQVTAIGDNALNYVKRGRTYALQVPEG
ncbi:hypothetical protein [Yoonia sp. 2307UL14-13]|uniref:hypothetical protein n=1 Tax=Yoonia sp. 2307UL14-13 TaxID=3126506 RepID=UPI0030B7417C